MSNPRIRASDADRDRTAALLREHHAEGRLTAEEFHERLDKAFAAKTLGELDELLSDLPGIDLYKLPDASLRRRSGPPGGYPLPWLVGPAPVSRLSPAWKAAWGSWLSVSLVCFVVWLLAGHPGNLWFLWVAGPWGALLLGRWLAGAHPQGRDRRSRRDRRRPEGRA
ncbi:MAG: DUF1707 domain-containing protein [Actinobacteria bacterium]|nr:DUF1707 domain-containing protein [Actinomycetota bacterium]